MSHKCSWELLFFDSKDTEVLKADRNKLVASNEKQTACLACITQTCQLSVSTIVKVSVMKNISWCGCCSL